MRTVKGKPFVRIIVRWAVSLLLILLGLIGFVALNRPWPELPDTSDWHTGDIFFSVGDS